MVEFRLGPRSAGGPPSQTVVTPGAGPCAMLRVETRPETRRDRHAALHDGRPRAVAARLEAARYAALVAAGHTRPPAGAGAGGRWSSPGTLGTHGRLDA